MKIPNTSHDSRHPWPTEIRIQGGASGLVTRPIEQGGNYGTAFVECFPPDTFIRGEGLSLTEAEDNCWVKYQRFLNCTDGGEHGPYEPRQYENGSGFCVKCNTWFSHVCTPSLDYIISELACELVVARYGSNVTLTSQWAGLVADEKAKLWAERRGEPQPEPTSAPPSVEELSEHQMSERELIEGLTQVLTNLAGRTREPG